MLLKKNKIIPIVFLLILGIVYLVAEYNRLGDFKIFLDAGKLLKEETNIYIYNDLNNFKYYYSPLYAIIMSFCSNLDYKLIALIWKCLNLFFLYRIWKILTNHFIPLNTLSDKQQIIFQVISILSCFVFIESCLHLVQMSIFLLYVILEGYYLIQNRQLMLAGTFLIALGINIKIMPIVILPYLIYRKQYLPSLLILAFSIVLIITPSIFIGTEYNQFLHAEWWKSINPLNNEHILDINERGFHSLSALISALFTDQLGNEGNLQLKRNILNLNPQTIEIILNVLRVTIILYTLKILSGKPFSKLKSLPIAYYELAYILLVTPLIFPHQQVYGFVFAIPAIFYLVYELLSQFWKTKKLGPFHILFIIASLFTSSIILLGFIKPLLFHFKILTYGILLFLIVFIRTQPKGLLNSTTG